MLTLISLIRVQYKVINISNSFMNITQGKILLELKLINTVKNKFIKCSLIRITIF